MKKLSLLLIVTILVCLPITSLALNGDEAITRADFLIELLTEGNIEVEETLESSFIDVSDPNHLSYIEAAYKNEIVSGYGDAFKPNDNVTKEQAVAMLIKVFGQKSILKNISEEDINNTLVFSDSSSISTWAKSYITYALDNSLIKEDKNDFYPQMLITKNQAKDLISTAKLRYEELFTRDGLSASDVLILANEKNNEYNTYKQKGTMEMNMKMNVTGLTEEELESNEEMSSLLDQGMNMNIDMDIQVEVPDRAYIKEVVSSPEGNEALDMEIEIFMDGTTMYTKMTGTDKWSKQDMSSIMNQIQSMSNNEPYKMAQLSDDDLKFFKDYARFDDNIEIANSEHYVISIDIDKDTYRDYYMEIMEKAMDSVVDLQTNNPQFQQDPSFDPDQYKQIMMQIVSQMEVEIEYKFYVDKETTNYDKMWISQDMYMSMDHLIGMLQESIEGEDIPPNVSVSMINHMEGEFSFYDFDGEVNFPEINPEDIMDGVQTLPLEITEDDQL